MESEAPVKEGDILAGKYRIERVLGVGGMGVVVSATHTQLDQKVAIKFLLPEAMRLPEIVQRFGREARSAAKIESEHVARVIDVGTLDSGAPYMVMEYLEGQDLSGVLEKEGAQPIERSVGYLLQACEAIAAAHALGIVHRDLKPANLFLARRADRPAMVKVLDFGISKTRDSAAEQSLTRSQAVMGSPLYMSPEQMRSTRTVDTRADIYALGVILYELVSNGRPFGGETFAELVGSVLTEPPRPLTAVLPNAPADFVAVVHRCLEKDPANRYSTVAELAAALVPFAPARQRAVSLDRINHVLGTTTGVGVKSGEPSSAGTTQIRPPNAMDAGDRPSEVATAQTQLTGPVNGQEAGAPAGLATVGLAKNASAAPPPSATGVAWANTSADSPKPLWKRPVVAIVAVLAVGGGVLGVMFATGSFGKGSAPSTAGGASTSTETTAQTAAQTTAQTTAQTAAQTTAQTQAGAAPTAPPIASVVDTATAKAPASVTTARTGTVPGVRPTATAAPTTTATATATAAPTNPMKIDIK